MLFAPRFTSSNNMSITQRSVGKEETLQATEPFSLLSRARVSPFILSDDGDDPINAVTAHFNSTVVKSFTSNVIQVQSCGPSPHQFLLYLIKLTFLVRVKMCSLEYAFSPRQTGSARSKASRNRLNRAAIQ